MNARMTEKLEALLGSKIVAETVEDVKPANCGMYDESWLIFATEDGRWHTYSDQSNQLDTQATEEEARGYWIAAEEAEAQTRIEA